MVVGVESDVFQVVVLASGPDAVLGVRGPRVGSLLVAKEIGNELVHPGIGEEQVRGFREKRSRRNDLMLLRLEEIKKGLTDFPSFHAKLPLRSGVRGWLVPFLGFLRILLLARGRRFGSPPGWFP